MAQARIPGWDYATEREAFMHYATAFCADSHRPPSGWSVESVARKRAEEQALKLAFGKEPSQSRQMYSDIITADNDAAAAALYAPATRAALPAPSAVIEGDFIDDAQLEADIVHATEVVAAERAEPATIDDTPFTTPEAAIQWGVTQGAFTSGVHSKNAYNKLKTEAQPQTSRAMAALWRADVARRLTEKVAKAETAPA
jgi:hypothetical protein